MPRNCRETSLPLNCGAITLTAGVLLKQAKMSSLVGERQFRRHFERQFGVRVIASQKLPRDSGESICAARHQDVSHEALWAQRGPIEE